MRCAREGCDGSLDGLRVDARYCSSACKSADWRARTGYVLVGRQKASQTRKTRGTRPSDVRYSHETVLIMVERAMRMDAPIHVDREAQRLVSDYSTAKQRALIAELGL